MYFTTDVLTCFLEKENAFLPRPKSRGILQGFIMKTTDRHVFFWSGPFSNWHRGARFDGATAYEETVRRLDEAEVPHPARDAVSSRILRIASFSCGEQWMMAMKSWLMTGHPILDMIASNDDLPRELLAAIRTLPPVDGGPSFLETAFARILANDDPRGQKAIGRRISPYDDRLWSTARVPCVVGGNVARFRADTKARRTLLETGTRTLVEGSPDDRIWGVGLKWDDPKILDPSNWRGGNLLGVSLHEVRAVIEEDAR